jgi:hypothetical protein
MGSTFWVDLPLERARRPSADAADTPADPAPVRASNGAAAA